MRRLFLMLAVFFISATTCFAYNTYQETLHGTDVYIGKDITINAYCYSLVINAYWASMLEGASGSVVCGEPSTATIYGQHSWIYDGTSQDERYHTRVFDRNVGTVTFYLEAYRCYGDAELTWTI